MTHAHLTEVQLTNFKSYKKTTTIALRPLTVLLGRNNSGKSSVIQALLLLKQTLELGRSDVPVRLEGLVDALSLRELTHGWPSSSSGAGPTIGLRWKSVVDVALALDQAKDPDVATLISHSGIHWLDPLPATHEVETSIRIGFAVEADIPVITDVEVMSFSADAPLKALSYTLQRRKDGEYTLAWNGEPPRKMGVEWLNFIPYLIIDRRNVGPRSMERSWHNIFLLLFAQPLDDLRDVLMRFVYLGPMRTQPYPLYKPLSVPSTDIGVSGEYAAQVLHARRADLVHYLPPLGVTDSDIGVPDRLVQATLTKAVNDIFYRLGLEGTVSTEEIKDVGFKLLFGRASLQHVGRGLSYILPVVEAMLLADPLRFKEWPGLSPAEYRERCSEFAHCAFEEPEAHLHPKVQTQLAHWLVSSAMTNRNLIVETHSDHLIRRLRGLAARAPKGSKIEEWLISNVVIHSVQQTDGESAVSDSALTPTGGLDSWPADFLDESRIEERSIYEASLEKDMPSPTGGAAYIHDEGEMPE